MTTIINRFADDVPVTTNELALAMRVSRYTVMRWKSQGYRFLYGRKTTPAHLKSWLQARAEAKTNKATGDLNAALSRLT